MSGVFKKILSGSLILLISIVFSLILTELLVRVFSPQELIYLKYSEIWEPDDTFGWKHRSNISISVNAGEKRVYFKTDENGFRIGETKIESPTYKILALGDSFTEELRAEYEETVTGRLEQILSKNLGVNVQVVNTSVGGWGPNQYLLQAETELDRDKYNIVLVFLYIGNDITDIRQDKFIPTQVGRKHNFRLPHNFSKKEFIDAVAYPVNDFFETKSDLFALFKIRARVLLMKLGLTANYFPDVFFKSEAKSPRYKITAEICSDIKKTALNQGLETVFVLIPTSQQVQEDTLREYIAGFNIDTSLIDMTQPNRLLKEYSEDLDLFVIDPLPEMREEYNKKRIRLYGIITDHFNSEGHRVLADVLAPVLEKMLESEKINN